jgi:hypothetical protein
MRDLDFEWPFVQKSPLAMLSCCKMYPFSG